MADMKDVTVSAAVDAYVKGYEAGWANGLEAAKKYLLSKAQKLVMENEVGEYVYLSDLREYMERDL